MMKFICLIFLLVITSTFMEAHEKIDPENWIRGIKESYAAIDNYTAIFHKRECINGNLKEEEAIFLKFKKPFKVYMKWIKEPYKGRETLYVEGWNENQMMVHEGGIAGVVTVNLNPKGSIAMKNSRHPITDSGLGNLINLIGKNMRRGMRTGELEFKENGEETVYGRKTQKVELLFPKDKAKGYYCYRAIINLDAEMKLPLRVQIYDWDDMLIENYGYENLKLNAGLTDTDFDPKNPAYKF